ncbi:hypothetical protein C6501_17110 [Candidatus Poribacteria bacterium]|nr:MAG: hypothetical protein C6501_17110 [Candidatus Poribacteria bacterium]
MLLCCESANWKWTIQKCPFNSKCPYIIMKGSSIKAKFLWNINLEIFHFTQYNGEHIHGKIPYKLK